MPVKDEAVHHLLEPVAADQPLTATKPAIAVSRAALPSFLDSEQLVTRVDGALVASDLDLWGEPLDLGISRVVAGNLGRLTRSANIMLPLCDMKKVDRLPIEEYGPYCFSVHCPPASLILKAENNAECNRWIEAITYHAALWKNKAAGALGSTSNSKSPPPAPPTTDPASTATRDFSTGFM
jgi:hypothetical protein